ncbi:sensor histidine kinase [Loigolactobacillus jiayinensis]|uniref:Sensor histidine kinase n=1 Tax=Loigolactobacillus jiayinensis TaxID=2486016 RepID=A0ABW1R9A0_9LACO|nr:GHKL domain-containing protein [Loigolactobacillus jiayinensis]
MYMVSTAQFIVSDLVVNFWLIVLYRRMTQQKQRLLMTLILAFAGAWIGLFMVDAVDAVFLLIFGLYRLVRKCKWYSFHTLVFIFILAVDMLLANCSTYLGNLFFAKPTWPSEILTAVINSLLYLALLLGYPLVEPTIQRFKKTMMQPQLLKVVINFALIVFLTFQFVQMTADVLDIAVFLQWLLIIFMAFFIAATIAVMVYFIRAYQVSLQQKAAAQAQTNLTKYTDELAANYQQLRKFKHDYQNVLLSLGGYIERTTDSELKDYYRQIVTQTNQTLAQDNLRFAGLEKLRVPALRSLVYQKLAMARHLHINAALEVRDVINAVPVDTVNLVQVLGILFDNALEATQQQEQGMFRVAFIRFSATELEVVIQNTLTAAVPMNKLFQSGYTTKGADHGLGLATVKQIVAATPNMALTVRQLTGKYQVIIDLVGSD